MPLLRATVVLLVLSVVAVAQEPAAPPPPSGSISGRVTVEKGGPRQVTVLIFRYDRSSMDRKALSSAKADEEGRYHFDGLAAGEYVIAPSALGYVGDLDWRMGYYGRQVSLASGEAIKGVDISLVKGGVVTGRVTDSEGRPVVDENVRLTLVGEDGTRKRAMYVQRGTPSTDDRGVYRIYGIAPGRYLVSVGQAPDDQTGSYRVGEGGYYAKTFHPSASSEDGATAVGVTGGSEARDIDIVVGRRAKSYRAKGRVVDAESGKPVVGARVGRAQVTDTPNGPALTMHIIAYQSDERGEFTIDALMPGRYAAFVSGGADEEKPWEWYGDPALFEVSGDNVDGIEISLHPAVHVSGTVVLEGTTDPALKAKLALMRVGAWTEMPDAVAQSGVNASSQVGPDGAFDVTNVRPGRVSINIWSWPKQKGFELLRVERDGVEQSGAIEVVAGESVRGLRVVLGYGTGTIRGRIEVKGGEVPAGVRFGAVVRRAGLSANPIWTNVDTRRQFLVEGLPPGEYEIKASMFGEGREAKTVTKTVTVANDAEAAITIEIDPKGEGGGE